MSSPGKSPALPREAAASPPAAKRYKRKPAGAQQSLALQLPRQASRQLLPAAPASRLWLCIHLPQLPLEALEDEAGALPRAVFDEQQGMRKVLLANTPATAVGIGPGLSANAALALLPELSLAERDPAREERVLQQLAGWAGRFTSLVSIERPAALLLELAGSLRLFGGMTGLRQEIAAGLVAQGFTAAMAIAPAPLAAVWLAKSGRRVCIRNTANLAGALSDLPLQCLDWPESVYETLEGMGISRIGDCLRLPRQGFARRFGAERLLQLDRAMGRLPDPRQGFRVPERFSAEYELAEEQDDGELLLSVCRELLLRLERFLLTRQQVVQALRFSFFHLQAPATQLSLGCMQLDGAAERWFELLKIKFERLDLAAPVIAVRLRGGQGEAFSAATKTLPWHKTERRGQVASMACLVERLSARIGSESVHGVTAVAEHRPQYAWRPDRSPGSRLAGGIAHCQATPGFRYEGAVPQPCADARCSDRLRSRRPLWMLFEPRPLAVEQGRPAYQGVLNLLDGPERLETGWWDEDGIARDYFVASNPCGVSLWIFQNRNTAGGWYLHGIFA